MSICRIEPGTDCAAPERQSAARQQNATANFDWVTNTCFLLVGSWLPINRAYDRRQRYPSLLCAKFLSIGKSLSIRDVNKSVGIRVLGLLNWIIGEHAGPGLRTDHPLWRLRTGC